MRENVAIFYVAKEEYRIACQNKSTEIAVEHIADYDVGLKKMDFILIGNHNQCILRNFVQIKEMPLHFPKKKLIYTLGLLKDGTDISLQAVSTLCFDAIMRIRNEVSKDNCTNKWIFVKGLKSIECNINIIFACIDLIDEMISVESFMEQLVDFEQNIDDFYFQSMNAVLKKYGWNNQCDSQQKKLVDTMRQGCYKMENLLANESEWGNIWKVAYGLHNLPDLLLE